MISTPGRHCRLRALRAPRCCTARRRLLGIHEVNAAELALTLTSCPLLQSTAAGACGSSSAPLAEPDGADGLAVVTNGDTAGAA